MSKISKLFALAAVSALFSQLSAQCPNQGGYYPNQGPAPIHYDQGHDFPVQQDYQGSFGGYPGSQHYASYPSSSQHYASYPSYSQSNYRSYRSSYYPRNSRQQNYYEQPQWTNNNPGYNQGYSYDMDQGSPAHFEGYPNQAH